MTTIIKHGVSVVETKVAVSDFAKKFNTVEGCNSHFDGSWDTLVDLVMAHWDNQEPGFGSQQDENGEHDVILVNVPVAGFYTPIVRLNDSNRHLVVERQHIRQDGEKPVIQRVIPGGQKSPAEYVQIVIYRADVLDRDSDRSSDAEWEIIAVNAQLDAYTPMEPQTMLRNSNHDKGGTYRDYTQQQWDEAYEYWANHVKIDTKS